VHSDFPKYFVGLAYQLLWIREVEGSNIVELNIKVILILILVLLWYRLIWWINHLY